MNFLLHQFKYLFLLISLINLTNCYFNPVVQKFVETDPKEDNSLLQGLSLLGLTPPLPAFPISISGQLRDDTGAAEANVQLTVISRANALEGLEESTTTDTAGRFFIRLSSGTTKIGLTKAGSPYYNFTLQIISPLVISVIEMNGNPVGAEITGLVSYDPGNQPVFFELTDSEPKNNSTIGEAPFAFYFYFSAQPTGAIQGQIAAWLAQNILVTPSISLNNVSSEESALIISTSNFLPEDTNYTISLGPGIISSSGVPLTPRTINFTCLASCAP